MPTTFETLDELRGAAGTHLGWTGWTSVDRAQVDRFAEATGGHQWIPIDVVRAKADSPSAGRSPTGTSPSPSPTGSCPSCCRCRARRRA